MILRRSGMRFSRAPIPPVKRIKRGFFFRVLIGIGTFIGADGGTKNAHLRSRICLPDDAPVGFIPQINPNYHPLFSSGTDRVRASFKELVRSEFSSKVDRKFSGGKHMNKG